MKNNTNQISIDQMLQDAFLSIPETNENLNNMTAQFIFSEEFTINVSAKSEKKFLQRFQSGGNLQIPIWTYFLAGILFLTGVFLFLNKNPKSDVEESAANSKLANNTNQVPIAGNEMNSPKYPKKQGNFILPSIGDSLETIQNVFEEEEPMFEVKTEFVNVSGIGGGNNIGSQRKRILLEIPVITAEEAKKNEERKQLMIKQFIKKDKKEWAYSPMGTFTFKNKQVSVQAFFIMTHEITNIQYRTFLYDLVLQKRFDEYDKAAVQDSGWLQKGSYNSPYVEYYFKHPAYEQYPVVNISPVGAEAFCRWLTMEANAVAKAKGLPLDHDIRIPVEAEWFYAAKSGVDSNIYGFTGNSLTHLSGKFKGDFRANFRKDRGDYMGVAGSLNDNADITAPVFSYWPNSWGLYNMSGNVAEMTIKGINGEGQYICKGGSWIDLKAALLVDADTLGSYCKIPSHMVGFRPVCTFWGK